MKMFKRIFTILILLGVSVSFVAAQPFNSFKFALVTDTHLGNPNNNEDLL